MMLITGTDESPTFKKLSEEIVDSTGVFLFDEDEGGVAVLIKKGRGYEFVDISEVTRKDAPSAPVRSIAKKEEN